ncbi:MAG: sensor histidine kinase [Candidatus Dormibacteria bacterium]
MTPTSVRRRALRIAAISTALVAAILAVLVTTTDLLVVRNLTAGVQDRLRDQLTAGTPAPAAVFTEGSAEHDFSEPVLRWSVAASGHVSAAEAGSPSLPDSLRSLTGYTTASIAGTQFGVLGQVQSDGHRDIVATSMVWVSNALAALIVAELIVGPLLLLAVFGGAYVIGRRTAAPIEAMRQRHLNFTADASHELRTPLSVITAETSLLAEDVSGDVRSSVDRISGEADRMRHIVEDLLWLARFDSEPEPPLNQAVDLASLASVTADRFRPVAAQRQLSLVVSAPCEGDVIVHAPAEWIDRLAGVLVDNACRYTPPGGTVEVAVGRRGGHPTLSVRDDGPGIPEGDAQRIFDRFHRGPQSGQGAGLGLAIADAVARATGGRWDITRPAGGGAQFTVEWRR